MNARHTIRVAVVAAAAMAWTAGAYERLQGPTELLFHDSAKAFAGYTIFGVGSRTYLLDMQGRVVHTWPIGTNPHLLDNGHILDASRDDPSGFGGFTEVDWDGKKVWEYTEKREGYSPHHDWVRIHNKALNAPTTLYIANRSVTHDQAVAAGADPAKGPYREGQMDAIVEVDMAGNVVWEWGFFDHVVQCIDPSKPNYAKSPAERPGRIDINMPGRPLRRDWLHCNSIDYSSERGHIVINSVQGELYVIDHDGTFVAGDAKAAIAKAAGPAGDFLYRFGDPARYAQGEPPRILENWDSATSGHKQMGGSHHASWIPAGLPGAGHLMVFNNGQYLYQRTPQSSALEIDPCLDADGRDAGRYVNPPDAGYRRETYDHDTHNSPRDVSRQIVWSYRSANSHGFFSHIGSSAQRLPNGNTFICSDTEGHFFEVTTNGVLAWEYINPFSRDLGTVTNLPDALPMVNSVFRAFRIAPDHPALKGRELTPKGTITQAFPAAPSPRRPEAGDRQKGGQRRGGRDGGGQGDGAERRGGPGEGRGDDGRRDGDRGAGDRERSQDMKTTQNAVRSGVAAIAVAAASATIHAAPTGAPKGFAPIPGGTFEMGDHHGFVDPKHGGDETPLHMVTLDPFFMGIFDVTTLEYCNFLNAALATRAIEVRKDGVYAAGGNDLLCDTRASSISSPIGWDGVRFSVLDRRERHPMVCVRWHGAALYCNWAGAQSGLPACYNTTTWACDFNKSGYRLPTEAEWEWAGRGGQLNPYANYPWGDAADPARANVPESDNPFRAVARPSAPPAGYRASGGGPGREAWRSGAQPLTTPVGFFDGTLHRKAEFGWPGAQETYQSGNGANGFGLYDMCGNVWQWCTEWYDRSYYAYAPATNPPGPAVGSPMPDGKPYRCMRGGSWFNGEFGHGRVSNRDPSYYRGPDPVTGLSDADGPWFHIGFRMVLPVAAERRAVVTPTVAPAGGIQGGRMQRGQGQPGAGERDGGGRDIGAGAAGQGGMRPVSPVTLALDLNGDGSIDADEIARAPESLKKADADGDGRISAEEYRPPRPGNEGAAGGRDSRPPEREMGGPRDQGGPGPQGGGRDERPQPRDGAQTDRATSSGIFSGVPKSGSFKLTSPAIATGTVMPKEFTGDGDSVNPPLEWAGAPEGTRSYALIMHHTDARGEDVSYWIIHGIPAEVRSLPRDAHGIGTEGIGSRSNRAGYTPPHSKGPGTRTYVFTVYALSAAPQFPASTREVGHEALMAAMKGHILDSADLALDYTRYTADSAGTASDSRGGKDERAEPRAEGQQDSRFGGGQDGNRQRPAPREDARGGDGAVAERPAGRQDRPGGDRGGPGGPEAGGGERRPGGGGGGGGGGRMTEHNKTPVSPNPGQTVGLFMNTAKACPGYTLLAPKHNTNTYLINNQGQVVHQWSSQYYPGQSVYLKPNGNLLHTCMTRNRSFTGGGEGGRIEEYDWSGKLLWEFWFSNERQQQHHDIAPMPNGNILMLVVEKKSREECIAAGFPEHMLRDSELYPDSIVEVQPVYPDGGKVVWEWHVWDHLIQDYDRTKPNYGDVAANPGRIYPGGGRGTPAFWNHVNSIAYNAKLDQISISARGSSEIWVIDHSTTSAEAAGRAGGKHGKGGDLIYRWGNPSAYKRGTEQDAQLNQQHDGEWVPDGCPGAGHMTIFNNGYNRGYTSIEEIVPPMDAAGRYLLEPGQPYGPAKPVWHYEAANRTDFFSSEISGAHRLPNGNTLICAGVIGHLFEVTPAGETVWQYVNPAVRGGILAQGELPGKDVRGHLFNAVFKARRYAPDYPGLLGRDLTPKGTIELPASMKGTTGFDQADAVPGEHPPEVGGGPNGREDRDRGGQGGGNRAGRPPRDGARGR